MQKSFIALALLSSAFFTAAQADEAMAQKYACIACHQIEAKLIGPGYKEVAAKYKGDANAPQMLFDKVRAGGTGVWGDMVMLPHPAETLPDEDLKALITWILSL